MAPLNFMKHFWFNRSRWAALFLVSMTPSVFAGPVWLSSLDLSQMTTGWSGAKADKEITGQSISIGKKTFDHGVGTHATSKFRIDVDGHATRFTAEAGVDDSSGTQGSVQFIVSGDGKVLWKSKVMTGGQPAKKVDVDLTGVKILSLSVNDGGDGESNDHADWADAKIEMADGFSPTTLPPFEIHSVTTKNLKIDFEVGDDGRLYQHAVGMEAGKLQRAAEGYPQAGDGYIWEPALQVVHADGNTSTALLFDSFTQSNDSTGREQTDLRLHDPAYPLQVTIHFLADKDRDVIEQWEGIEHHESGPITLERMASTALLLPSTNIFLTHFFGDWAKEMLSPITERLTQGTKILDSKIGVRADQFQNPNFVLSLDGPPQENSGRVLAGSLEWSGSFQCAFDDDGDNVRALCGVNPFASAYHLKKGVVFTTPRMIWAWSANGLGDMSRNLHKWARDYGMRDGHRVRSVLLNNWEATGFDFDFDRIVGLYDPAKAIGTELFLLDDGWFGNKYPRVNDHAGLGDWQPNRSRLPNGLAPLASEAVKRGLQFGIWMEPEMVNPKSELYEKHPDWVVSQPKRELELQRNQLVLDLTRPEVQASEWQSIQDILGVPDISFAKWDCNRYLTQPGSSYLPPDRQSHLWIDYTKALYALMDKVVEKFPDTELMLCSGGGGRVDYGALKHFHEFWPSDNTDPTMRVPMQWDYSYFFPPMAICGHVTHWGNRPMHFACSVAMSVRFGMDLDLNKLSAEDKAICAGAISAYKQIREVTQLGDLYRLEDPHGNYRGAINYVSPDQMRAVVFAFQLQDGPQAPVHPLGLDPNRSYTVHELNPAPGRAAIPQEGKTLTGEELMRDGIIPSCKNAVESSVIELGE